jgi:hypothetical protein
VFGSEELSADYNNDVMPGSDERVKIPEEKANKIGDTFTLVGRFISGESLPLVVDYMKEVLEKVDFVSYS